MSTSAAPSPAPTSELQAVIFDIGNVILRFDFNRAMSKMAGHCDPLSVEILARLEPVKLAYEGGRMTRPEFLAEWRSIFRYTSTDEDFVAAFADIFTENEPVVALIRQLHGRLPLYLLSNTNDIHIDFIFRQYPVFGLFTDAVYSHVVKASKPERAIYEIAARQFGVTPAETLFIDDLQANVESAREAGFRAHHYHHERHGDLLTELRKFGLPGPRE